MEYLGRVVFNTDGLLYPDSLVGTDSHTTMINGLGILGWGMNLYMKIFNKYIANLKLKLNWVTNFNNDIATYYESLDRILFRKKNFID